MHHFSKSLADLASHPPAGYVRDTGALSQHNTHGGKEMVNGQTDVATSEKLVEVTESSDSTDTTPPLLTGCRQEAVT